MNQDQFLILLLVTVTVVMLFWGRFRHDVVALGSLLAGVLMGLVPQDAAFGGFSHPAVITVAAVLILSQGLRNTGLVDVLAQRLLPSSGGLTLRIVSLTTLGAFLSAFMNNVGAMALLMPIAIQMAKKFDQPPGIILMPLSFATILGGMTTLIGTPPNLIVSGYRADIGRESFGMFDFTSVGLAVAVSGVLLISLVGWRVVPKRTPGDAASFDTGNYLTEVRVTEKSKTAGLSVREVDEKLSEADAQIVGMVRNQFRIFTPVQSRRLLPGDLLVIEADPESLASTLSLLDLELESQVENKEVEQGKDDTEAVVDDETEAETETESEAERKEESPEAEADLEKISAGDAIIRELVAMPNSSLVGQSADDIMLRDRYGLNLLAISRQGRQSIRRLRSTRIQAGDVLLLQGGQESLTAFSAEFGSVPLAERAVGIPDSGKATMAALVMVTAITFAAFGLLPAAIAFTAGVVAFVVSGIVTTAKLYDAIDWPVIVLLGALLPIADAMANTGAADLLANFLVGTLAKDSPVIALILIMVLTMTLSDFMNNAATAAVMCPIAYSIAITVGASPDAFLMAVAIGASCAMLTPIGHQNNTLILGPGGFRFGDYWKLGLPLEILVIAVSVPALLHFWPI